ncbi:hypothetical protein U0D62_04565 [Aquimarina sp. 2201CG5-10]|nr:hypothetical protein [Aquimarina sp. 2201CG5-10]
MNQDKSFKRTSSFIYILTIFFVKGVRVQVFERPENSYMATKDITGSEDEYNKGLFDDLRIYARALTNEEIKLLFEE